MKWRIPFLVLAAALAFPSVTLAAGAWTTFLRPLTFTDLIAGSDTVWCGSLDGGLVRYLRSSDRFESVVREPGGLASNRIQAISFDGRGRLWVGTDGSGASLLSADGGSWRVVNGFDGLPSDSITVLEAQGDSMWIGTTRGIALWNGQEISGVLPDGSGTSPFASNTIRGVAVLQDSVWVATASGIYRSLISSGLSVWTPFNAGLPTLDIVDLATNGRDLMALDSLRVFRFDPATSRWTRTPDISNARRLSDDRGAILAMSNRGIHRWNGTGWDRPNSTLQSPGIARRDFAVGVDPTGRLFAANQDGLYRQPDGAGAWPLSTPPGPPGNNVLNLGVEGDRLYVATVDEGFARYDGTTWRHWLPGSVRNESDTTFRAPSFGFALLVDTRGKKWFGCWDNALEALDDSDPPNHVDHLWPTIGPCCPDALCQPACRDTTASHTFAWAAAVDSSADHGLWFGMDTPRADVLPAIGLDHYSGNGVFLANYRKGRNAALHGSVIHALTVDRNGRVWVGYAGDGIDVFDWPPVGGGSRPVPDPTPLLASEDVKGLVATHDAVWALTSGRLYRISLGGHIDFSYDLVGQPSDLGVNSIDAAPDGSVWVGTARGLTVYRAGVDPVTYTTINSPLTDDGVRSVRIDPRNGVVWVGTSAGINRFDPSYLPPAVFLPRLELSAYPNPARLSVLGVGVRLSSNVAELRGEVYDLSGRILRRFRAASGQVVWDGLDGAGDAVKPGIYFLRAESGGRSGVVRVVLVR